MIRPPAEQFNSARRALTWLGSQGHHFSPRGKLSTKAAKPAVELGILLYALSRPGDSLVESSDAAVVGLVDIIEAIGKRPDVRFSPVASTAACGDLWCAQLGGAASTLSPKSCAHRPSSRDRR